MSLMKFKKILTAILRIIKKSVNAETSNNSITKQSDIVSNIDSKLTLVTEKINAESEKKLKKKTFK